MGSIEPKTTGMFHFAGNRTTTPNCPVVMKIDFNPAMGVQSYKPTNALCTTPAAYRLPFWRARPGPSYEEYGVNSHEARPGHHTQVSHNSKALQCYIIHYCTVQCNIQRNL